MSDKSKEITAHVQKHRDAGLARVIDGIEFIRFHNSAWKCYPLKGRWTEIIVSTVGFEKHEWEIGWSSIGSVDPEICESFARSMLAASKLARELTRQAKEL